MPMPERVAIRFFSPYGKGWMIESFGTMVEARRKIAFYQSCGAQAHLV